jgi:sugar phosphate isomerase/epimerase
MRFSVTTFASKGLISPQELMPRLQAWGYDGIELWVGDLPGGEGHIAWFRQNAVPMAEIWPGDEPTAGELKQLHSLKALAEGHGLSIPMISPYFDFTAGQRRWQESLAVGQRCIQYAIALDAPLIRCMGGRIPSAEMTEADWDSCLSGLKALTQLPGAEHVIFALECHPNRPGDTIESILREVNEVGADNLKILLQPSSFIGQANTREILHALYARSVHIHAGLRNQDVDWPWLLGEMVRRGYQGYLSIEGAKDPRLAYIEKAIAWLHEVTAE